MSIISQIKATAHKYPNKIALIDKIGEITFADLLEESHKIAKKICATHSLNRSRVCILRATNDRNFVAGLIALLECQLVVTPVIKNIDESELEFIKTELKANYILTVEKNFDCSFEQLSFNENLISRSIENPCAIRFTSGTTGKSKAVILSEQTITDRIELVAKGLNFSENDTVLFTLTMAFHFVVSIILYLNKGMTVIVSEDFSLNHLNEMIKKYAPTVAYAAPLDYMKILESNQNVNFSSFRLLISTSVRLRKNVADSFYNKFKKSISQIYGLIEVGLPIANLETQNTHPNYIGKVLPGYEVKIIEGKLYIKGKGIFDGYLNNIEKYKDVFVDGWFYTGDLASIDSDGNIKIIGREKSRLFISGKNISPEEIESVINELKGVVKSRVSSSSGLIVAEIEVNSNAITENNIKLYCENNLEEIMRPTKICIVDKIPMTSSGKILRN